MVSWCLDGCPENGNYYDQAVSIVAMNSDKVKLSQCYVLHAVRWWRHSAMSAQQTSVPYWVIVVIQITNTKKLMNFCEIFDKFYFIFLN